jgi:phosphoribosylformylglycinamidine synthase
MMTIAALFGESASRAVVSVSPENRAALLALAECAGVPAAFIGTTGGPRIRVRVGGTGAVDIGLDEAEPLWTTTIERYFAGRAA